MTSASLIIPDPLPKLPKISREYQKQASTHSSATTTENPASYETLACLGNTALQFAVTWVLHLNPDFETPGAINEARKVFLELQTVVLWGRAYKDKLNIKMSPQMARDAKAEPGISSGSFYAYLGALSCGPLEDLFNLVTALMTPTLEK